MSTKKTNGLSPSLSEALMALHLFPAETRSQHVREFLADELSCSVAAAGHRLWSLKKRHMIDYPHLEPWGWTLRKKGEAYLEGMGVEPEESAAPFDLIEERAPKVAKRDTLRSCFDMALEAEDWFLVSELAELIGERDD